MWSFASFFHSQPATPLVCATSHSRHTHAPHTTHISAATGRYLICGASLYYRDVCTLLRDAFPTYPVTPAAAPTATLKPEFDCTRAVRDLGWAPRDARHAITEQVQAVIAAGLASPKPGRDAEAAVEQSLAS